MKIKFKNYNLTGLSDSEKIQATQKAEKENLELLAEIEKVRGKLAKTIRLIDIKKTLERFELAMNSRLNKKDMAGLKIIFDSSEYKERAYKYAYEAIEVEFLRNSKGEYFMTRCQRVKRWPGNGIEDRYIVSQKQADLMIESFKKTFEIQD